MIYPKNQRKKSFENYRNSNLFIRILRGGGLISKLRLFLPNAG